MYVRANAKPWKDVVTTKEAFWKYPINSDGEAVWINPLLGIIGCDVISIISRFNFLAILTANLFSSFHCPIWYKRRYLFFLDGIAILSKILLPAKRVGSITILISLSIKGCNKLARESSLTLICSNFCRAFEKKSFCCLDNFSNLLLAAYETILHLASFPK